MLKYLIFALITLILVAVSFKSGAVYADQKTIKILEEMRAKRSYRPTFASYNPGKRALRAV